MYMLQRWDPQGQFHSESCQEALLGVHWVCLQTWVLRAVAEGEPLPRIWPFTVICAQSCPLLRELGPLKHIPLNYCQGHFQAKGTFRAFGLSGWCVTLTEEPQVLKMEAHHPWLGLVDLPGGICQPCLDLTRSTCVCIFSATCRALRVPASESHP